jgi:FdhD protein
VATEEPLEIRLEDEPIAVVMRTPGDDEDLVRGFLLSEAIIDRPDRVGVIEPVEEGRCAVRFVEGFGVDASRFQRNLFASSSCGVCGKATIEAIQLLTRPLEDYRVDRAVVASATDTLRGHQPTFDVTGGLHAAGLLDLEGGLLAVREDVGRHNAVDKAIGAAATDAWPLPPTLLVVSGRQSFEIVQKAAVTGIGGVIGVSAPSSLAVETASSLGMLLVGFARDGSYNVYAGIERIAGM